MLVWALDSRNWSYPPLGLNLITSRHPLVWKCSISYENNDIINIRIVKEKLSHLALVEYGQFVEKNIYIVLPDISKNQQGSTPWGQ